MLDLLHVIVSGIAGVPGAAVKHQDGGLFIVFDREASGYYSTSFSQTIYYEFAALNRSARIMYFRTGAS